MVCIKGLMNYQGLSWTQPPVVNYMHAIISWVLANIMTESSCCFWNCDRSAGQRFCVMVCSDFGLIIMYSFTPTVRSWWSQWVVMAACHCYLWWRWWSDTLWVVLIRLWPHSLLCCLQIVVEISLQFDRYACNCPYWILLVMQGISVRVRRPSDYNPAMAATLGPSQPSGHLNLAAVGLTPGYSFTCIFVCIWVSMVKPISMDLSCWIYQQSNKTKPDQNAAFLCSWVYFGMHVCLSGIFFQPGPQVVLMDLTAFLWGACPTILVKNKLLIFWPHLGEWSSFTCHFIWAAWVILMTWCVCLDTWSSTSRCHYVIIGN
jgi:hypothetical protein